MSVYFACDSCEATRIVEEDDVMLEQITEGWSVGETHRCPMCQTNAAQEVMTCEGNLGRDPFEVQSEMYDIEDGELNFECEECNLD